MVCGHGVNSKMLALLRVSYSCVFVFLVVYNLSRVTIDNFIRVTEFGMAKMWK